MQTCRPIQLDDTFIFQQAAIAAVLRAITHTHGAAFAAAFVHEHRIAILGATRTRLCGRDARVAASEASRLSLAYAGR